MDSLERQTFRYKLSDVLPTVEAAAQYMHLDDPEHPAYAFMEAKRQELIAAPLEAVGCYVLFPVEALDPKNGVISLGGCELHLGRQVCGYMRGATLAALFLCTAGAVFTTQYRQYNKQGDYLEAYITDALGSLTVENAMDDVQKQLAANVAPQGLSISNRYSPGYCNWPLAEQKRLFSLVGPNETGITLSDSCLMYPTKSVSGIIGIGPKMKQRAYGCPICHNKNCIYRRIVQHDK